MQQYNKKPPMTNRRLDMYCRFSIISFIMLLNKSKTRAVKIKRIYDMYVRFLFDKEKRSLKN